MQASDINLNREDMNQELVLSLKKSLDLTAQILVEVQEMATGFREGMTPELAMVFDENLSGIQTLMASMMTMQMIASHEPTFALVWNDAYPLWQVTEGKFKNSLNDLLRSYGHEDYIGLSDTLEGEFTESLQCWQKFVTKMYQSMTAR